MTLVRATDDSTGPGLWLDSNWKPGQPGTFAVVIGVSRYDYLDGARPGFESIRTSEVEWIAEARRFGQLQVSSFTAVRMFSWLRDRYCFEAPLVRCWLLLSPTAEELPFIAAQAVHGPFAQPNFANCSSAIQWWFATMRDQPLESARKSRGLFFFSGHGLEITQDRQILLPSDFLSGPAPNLNAAISTSNLRYGVAPLQVPQQLFFIDACRNDQVKLRGKNVVGAQILVEDEAAAANPQLISPLLYATAPGQQAWQQSDPGKGISIFGQALVDGLCGTPNIKLKCDGRQCAIELLPLQTYARARVTELIADAGSKAPQTVKLSGTVEEMVVTYIDPLPPHLIEGEPDSHGPVSVDHKFLSKRWTTLEASGSPPMSKNIIEEPSDGEFGNLWAGNWAEGHRLFGSERVTELWQKRIRIWALKEQKWMGPEVLRINYVQRDPDRNRYSVRLKVDNPDPIGHWLQFVPETSGGEKETSACAIMLPNYKGMQPEYQQFSSIPDAIFEIVMDRTPQETGERSLRLESGLANTEGLLGDAAALWRNYSSGDLAEAIRDADANALRYLVSEKEASPIAATIGTLVLLRANRLDKLPLDWQANLANLFYLLPDGAILYAERKFREGLAQPENSQDAFREAADYLCTAGDRGLPFTSEAFSYAVSLAERLTPRKVDDEALFIKLGTVRERLDRALPYYRPGGLFGSFSGLEQNMRPNDLWLGAPKALFA